MPSTIEERKRIEIDHYEAQARRWRKERREEKWETDTHRLRHSAFSCYEMFDDLIRFHCGEMRVLDFGCGNGIHSIAPALAGAREVVGIDLSEESLRIARERADRSGVGDRVRFLRMDCERLEFPDGTFDIAIDGGTFSSLDLTRALPELARVLKADGKVIGIETLGHNPIFNAKRRLNVLAGSRTRWAAGHIFRVKTFDLAARHFEEVDPYFFHLTALFAIPFLRIPGFPRLLRALERLDERLLSHPRLKKHAFKTVFLMSRPRKAAAGGESRP